jgi:hypothetical protein
MDVKVSVTGLIVPVTAHATAEVCNVYDIALTLSSSVHIRMMKFADTILLT